MSRHEQCIEALSVLGEATAAEVGQYMVNKGYAKVFQRNLAHPRLNELVKEGIVEITGKKYDVETNRDVSTYALV